MQMIETNLGRLRVERHGAHAGPTIVGWPSLFCDASTMRPLVKELAHDHQVVLIDGPGHGGSSGPPRPFTLEACADAAFAVLDTLGVRKTAWIGSAWGGHVGVVAALRYPDRVSALVAMNAPMGSWTGRNRAMNWTLYWAFRLLNRPKVLARLVASMMIAPQRLAAHPELAAPILECMTRSERRPFFAAVRSAMLERPSLLPNLKDLRLPTLFMVGSEDSVFTVDEAGRQAAMVSGSQFEVVRGTSHLSLWEAPDLVLPLLRQFVTNVSRKEPPDSPTRLVETRP